MYALLCRRYGLHVVCIDRRKKIIIPVDENDVPVAFPLSLCLLDDKGEVSLTPHECYGKKNCMLYQNCLDENFIFPK